MSSRPIPRISALRLDRQQWRMAWFFASVVYFVTIGGTNAGEQLPLIRAVNMLLVAAVVIAWARRAHEGDMLDVAVIAGVLLFAAASLLSSNPRLSLDSTIHVLGFAALFSYGRRLLAEPGGFAALTWTFGGLCIGLTAFVAVLWGGVWLNWARHTGFSDIPPLSLPLPTALYLHRHDVALLIVMLAPALLAAIGFGKLVLLRILVFSAIGVVLLIDGSRTVLVSLVGAALVTTAVALRRSGRVPRALPANPYARAAIGLAAVAVVAGAILVGQPIITRALDLGTLSARGMLWSAAASMWLADPVSGTGPGTFLMALPETGYFERTSYFPRNTDGAPTMLLAETGLLGVTGVALVVLAMLRTPLSGTRNASLMLFAPAAFVIAGIGSVPADFVYLVVPAVVWLAAALPPAKPVAYPSRDPGLASRPVRTGAVTALGATSLAVALTLTAGSAYEAARTAIGRDDLAAAARHLTTATTIDPSFALYWRALGAVELGRGDHDSAIAALARAQEAEPRDWATHRLMALAAVAAGDRDLAAASADAIERLRPSEPIHDVVAALVARTVGSAQRADEHVDSYVIGAPYLAGVERWPASLGARRGAADAERLLASWLGDERPLALQPAFLSAMAQTDRYADEVAAAAARIPSTREALTAVFACEPAAAMSALDAAASAERATPEYWIARLIVGRVTNEDVSDELAIAAILGNDAGGGDVYASSPLGERWAYRRASLPVITVPFDVPPADVGLRRWLDDPRAAAASAGVDALAACTP